DLDRIAARIRGLEHVASARARGRGVVMVTGHFGPFELFGGVVARAGHPVRFLARPQSNPRVDALVTANRRALGVSVVPHGAGSRAAFAALRAGECVAVLADQDAGRRGAFVDFFGIPTSTPRGPAELSLRTGAPIVCGFLVRRPDGLCEGTLLPAI